MTPREWRRLKYETSRGIARFASARFGKETPYTGGGAANNSLFSFDLPLVDIQNTKFTIAPTYSAGSATPTFTRATTGTVVDFEGLLKTCLSGEVRCLGGRRVQNWLANSTDSSTWSTSTSGTGTSTKTDNYAAAPDGTITAARLVATKGSGWGSVLIPKTGTVPGTAIQQTSWIKSNTGSSQTVCLCNRNGAYAVVPVTTTWQRLTPGVQTVSAGGAGSIEIGAAGAGADASVDILIWHPQLEDVTGQTNQNPSEYVSVGVLSAPVYHGVGVDGVKVFTTLNGNTVASNVVTEATGLSITSARAECAGGVTAGVVDAVGPVGYLAEGARTNLCLRSQTFGTTWAGSVIGAVSEGITIAPDGTATADTITASGAPGVHSIYQTAVAATGATQTFSVFIKPGTHSYAFITSTHSATENGFCQVFDLTDGSVGQTDVGTTSGTITSASITPYPNGWFRCVVTGIWTQAAGTTYFEIGFAQAKTGNTFTAGQEVTFNTAGTETLILWGAQCETAAFASTYIPTTTVAVARNADLLSYVAAGSISATTGAAYVETYILTAGSGSYQQIVNWADYIIAIDTPTPKVTFYDGTNTIQSASFSTSTLAKMASSWGGVVAIACRNGASVSGTFDGSVGSGTSFYIGTNSVASAAAFNPIRNVRIYPRALSAAQLQAMTA